MSLKTFFSSKLYTLAIKSIQKRHYWISKGLLQLVVKLSPTNYKAWGYLGNCHRSKHNLEEAERCYRIAIDLDPHVIPIFHTASQENRRYALRKSNLRLQDLTFAHKPYPKSNESEIVEKLKTIMGVSTRIEMKMLRRVLGMSRREFEEKIFQWAVDYGFVVDGDYINIEHADVNRFLHSLDSQFHDWGVNEGKE